MTTREDEARKKGTEKYHDLLKKKIPYFILSTVLVLLVIFLVMEFTNWSKNGTERRVEAAPPRTTTAPIVAREGVSILVTWVKYKDTIGDTKTQVNALRGRIVYFDETRFDFDKFFEDYGKVKKTRYEGRRSLTSPNEFSGTWIEEGMDTPGRWRLFQISSTTFQGTEWNEKEEEYSLTVEVYGLPPERR